MVLISYYIPLADFCLVVAAVSDRWVLKSAYIIVVFFYRICQLCFTYYFVWCIQFWVCYVFLETDLFIERIHFPFFLWEIFIYLFFGLQSTLSDINISTALFLFTTFYTRYILYSFNFNLSISLDMKLIDYGHYIVGSCFFNQFYQSLSLSYYLFILVFI